MFPAKGKGEGPAVYMLMLGDTKRSDIKHTHTHTHNSLLEV